MPEQPRTALRQQMKGNLSRCSAGCCVLVAEQENKYDFETVSQASIALGVSKQQLGNKRQKKKDHDSWGKQKNQR
jgi:hypothetical protein